LRSCSRGLRRSWRCRILCNQNSRIRRYEHLSKNLTYVCYTENRIGEGEYLRKDLTSIGNRYIDDLNTNLNNLIRCTGVGYPVP
jgi:hypothetical protein